MSARGGSRRRGGLVVAGALVAAAASIVAVLALVLVSGGKTTGDSEQMTYQIKSDAGSFEVAEEGATWLDGSRSRPVHVRIYAPKPGSTSGRLPTLFITHGMGEDRDSYAYLGRHWAGYGYIVVSMTHQDSDTEAVKKLQAGATYLRDLDHFTLRFDDLTFAIDRLLAGDQESALIKGRADPDRIGIAGHSMGGDTSFQAIGMTINLPDGGSRAGGTFGETKTFRDPRVKAALQMGPHVGSAADSPETPKSTAQKKAITVNSYDKIMQPAMVMWGTRDQEFDEPLRSNPDARKVIYDFIPGKHKYMVDIVNAQHHAFSETVPWYPGGPRDPRHHGWIKEVTTAFFDAHVRGEAAALAWLESDSILTHYKNQIIYDYGNKAAAKAPPGGGAFKAERGPLSVEVLEELVLKDAPRGKDVRVRVTYPAAKGAYPVVLLSYYYGGKKEESVPLAGHWASHGYVVLQPDHSDRGLAGSGTLDFSNRWDRVADLTFVLDSLSAIQRAIGPGGPILDVTRVGAAGHLYGADTVELMLGLKVFPPQGGEPRQQAGDPRLKAAVIMSAQGRGQGLTEQSWAGVTTPMLVVTGSEDASRRTANDPRWRAEPFVYSPPGDKYLLFVEGLGSAFAGLIIPGREDNEQVAGTVLSGAMAFWDAYLKDDAAARKFLTAKGLSQEGVEFQVK